MYISNHQTTHKLKILLIWFCGTKTKLNKWNSSTCKWILIYKLILTISLKLTFDPCLILFASQVVIQLYSIKNLVVITTDICINYYWIIRTHIYTINHKYTKVTVWFTLSVPNVQTLSHLGSIIKYTDLRFILYYTRLMM